MSPPSPPTSLFSSFLIEQGGQSNPTFYIRTDRGEFVLRKKPPGKLLPSAVPIEIVFLINHSNHLSMPLTANIA